MSAARSTGLVVLLTALAASAPAQQPPAPPAAPPQGKPAFETQVITVECVHAVVLPMKGSYAQHAEAFGRLSGFLAGRGVTPSGPPFGRYFSDPSVGEASLVWEVGFPVPAGVTAEAPFEIREVPATLAAVHVHRGPMEMQVFKGDLAAAPEVEMRMPVQK